MRQLRVTIPKMAATIAAVISFGLLFAPKALASNSWYVSPLATGTVHDGKSWDTAWLDFSGTQAGHGINWAQVQQNDIINIDAGTGKTGPGTGIFLGSLVLYRTPLVVQQSGINIQVPANDSNHNGGTALIFLANPNAIGIDVGVSFPVKSVSIGGSKWSPNPYDGNRLEPNFCVYGGKIGAVVAGNYSSSFTDGNNLSNLHFQNCNIGLDIQGAQVSCDFCMINDNAINIKSEPQPSRLEVQSLFTYSRIDSCWIFNSNIKAPTPGVLLASYPNETCQLIVNQCVFGPGLSKTFQTTTTRDTLNCAYSLFINPSITNLQMDTVPNNVIMQNNISFLTPLNVNAQAHSCLGPFSAPLPYYSEMDSNVFYGGVVNVPGTQSLGFSNQQFKTSGNTHIVSLSQADPKFASNVAKVANGASFQTLMNLDFTPSANSPGASPGCMHSVNQLLGTVPH